MPSSSDRQSLILSHLTRDGRVMVDDLAAELDVTTQTIRRDLAALCDTGRAMRIHGGARAVSTIANVGYNERQRAFSAEKAAIGAAAAALIPDACSVMINIGTTTEHAARALAAHRDLVVISNNINVINLLMASPARELILAGGVVRPSDGAIVGENAVSFVERYKADYAIIGASALDADGAILDFDAREVSVARAILRNARCKILVADHTKFATTAPVRICDLADIDHFITDAPPPDAFTAIARTAGVRVHIAPKDQAP